MNIEDQVRSFMNSYEALDPNGRGTAKFPTHEQAKAFASHLTMILTKIRNDERERCAQLCESFGRARFDKVDAVANVCVVIAKDIRTGSSTDDVFNYFCVGGLEDCKSSSTSSGPCKSCVEAMSYIDNIRTKKERDDALLEVEEQHRMLEKLSNWIGCQVDNFVASGGWRPRDHACEKCIPGGELVDTTFTCAIHTAEDYLKENR